MRPKTCLGCARGFLFLVNLLFFALGSLLFAFGLWLLCDQPGFAAALGSPMSSPSLWSCVFLGVGAATVGLSFLGGLGALRRVRGLLGLYFGVLLLLLAAQIVVGVVVYTQRVALATRAATYAQELIWGYPAQGPPGPPHETWDALQQQLRCCGWAGPQDWNRSGDPPKVGGGPACSCLPPPNGTHAPPPTPPRGRCPTAAPQDVFSKGCAEAVWGWLAENLLTLLGGCLGIGLMELFLLMLSMFLIRNLDPDYEKLLQGL